MECRLSSFSLFLFPTPSNRIFLKQSRQQPRVLAFQHQHEHYPCQDHDQITKKKSIVNINKRINRNDRSLAAAFCDALDDLIDKYSSDAALHPSVDPRHVLKDNFAPVGELPPTPCPVIRGTIPSSLAGGAYIRNGPNPTHPPSGAHHLFEGDGMLHSLLLPSSEKASAAIFSSRFVETYKYLVECRAGRPIFLSVFSGLRGLTGIARVLVFLFRVLTMQVDPTQGTGLANTSLQFSNGRLHALCEYDLPYAVRLSPDDGDISTVGRTANVSTGSMTAHPKKDPVTGETFSFSYGPIQPYVTYFRYDRDGNKSGPDVPISSFKEPTFVHDFAITDRYAIFPDIQIVMKPAEIIRGRRMIGPDLEKVPRLGLLPRYARSDSDMRWFDVPGFNILHVVNAWEEEGGDVVVVVAPNVRPIENAIDRFDLLHVSVEMARIDVRRGTLSRTTLSTENLDFGVIHPDYTGKKNRYAYLGVGNPMPKISGVVKLDFELAGKGECVVAKREFGVGCFGGEPFFVPASSTGEEDDGYVVTYLHDEGKGESSFLVMDARSPELEIVAEVALPRRVPYGFHGLFVTEAELLSQR
uniref:Carotenoid cleavage dioxygenase n=1 Tax=Crocus ancyrensis TaxID=481016 RepID=A0A0N7CS36_9ASPA|nr:carotenoid cleavage dioxygenase [Crocus ancyrensis]